MPVTKVAGYCRVSTDQEDQANSFVSQQRYFREYISQHPDWELYEIYADEGISGTGTQKRAQFNRMIQDAFDGKFGLIITKEVSRFSRNILDTISYTRELRSRGIGVRFALDGIDTLSPDAELYLAIMASLAQEESRKTSARVVWGQTRQMEKGVVFGRSLLGYDVKDGIITVNPQGAEIVRFIFQKYAVEQIGTSRIAAFLTREGIPGKWTAGAVIRILRNEKYVGDLVQKKSYTPDYLTHRKRRNTGDVPKICIQNHHEPIVSRELWNLAQDRLEKNNKHSRSNGGHSNRYAFSGKIRCGECGAGFVGRFRYLKDGRRIRRWSCATAVREGTEGCGVGKILRDEDAHLMLTTALLQLPMDTGAVIEGVTDIVMDVLAGQQGTAGDPLRCLGQIGRLERKREQIREAFLSGELSKADFLWLLERCDRALKELQPRQDKPDFLPYPQKEEITSKITAILAGSTESDVFCKTILKQITVFKDRHMELKLNHLPQVFHFDGA